MEQRKSVNKDTRVMVGNKYSSMYIYAEYKAIEERIKQRGRDGKESKGR